MDLRQLCYIIPKDGVCKGDALRPDISDYYTSNTANIVEFYRNLKLYDDPLQAYMLKKFCFCHVCTCSFFCRSCDCSLCEGLLSTQFFIRWRDLEPLAHVGFDLLPADRITSGVMGRYIRALSVIFQTNKRGVVATLKIMSGRVVARTYQFLEVKREDADKHQDELFIPYILHAYIEAVKVLDKNYLVYRNAGIFMSAHSGYFVHVPYKWTENRVKDVDDCVAKYKSNITLSLEGGGQSSDISQHMKQIFSHLCSSEVKPPPLQAYLPNFFNNALG